jgi:hypothetical protein
MALLLSVEGGRIDRIECDTGFNNYLSPNITVIENNISQRRMGVEDTDNLLKIDIIL